MEGVDKVTLNSMIASLTEFDSLKLPEMIFDVCSTLLFLHKNEFYHNCISLDTVYYLKNKSQDQDFKHQRKTTYILSEPWLGQDNFYTYVSSRSLETINLPRAGDIYSLGGLIYDELVYLEENKERAENENAKYKTHDSNKIISQIQNYMFHSGTEKLEILEKYKEKDPLLRNFIDCCLILHTGSKTTVSSLLLHPYLDNIFKKKLNLYDEDDDITKIGKLITINKNRDSVCRREE